MFGIKELDEKLDKIIDAMKYLNNKIDLIESQINDLKQQISDITFPDTNNDITEPISEINDIYKTKSGLVSFKKAKRSIREENG